jgi:hypothetical protein
VALWTLEPEGPQIELTSGLAPGSHIVFPVSHPSVSLLSLTFTRCLCHGAAHTAPPCSRLKSPSSKSSGRMGGQIGPLLSSSGRGKIESSWQGLA